MGNFLLIVLAIIIGLFIYNNFLYIIGAILIAVVIIFRLIISQDLIKNYKNKIKK
jgi:hypothetical protein